MFFTRIFPAIAILIIILSIGSYIYLFFDTPFPLVDTSSLTITKSQDIEVADSTMDTDTLSINIQTKGEWFIDKDGRAMILNGINLGGSTKVPFSPLLESHTKDNFYESADSVSFVGRPFPIEEADQHFERLSKWGYRFVRLLVTWEAIEHEGPGKYDMEYLAYLKKIVEKAGKHSINVFIDPHQDVWSRFSGGDGAPYWTFKMAGINPNKFSETGAAVIHNITGDPFPKMIWPSNYDKFASATMFTLFFGGKDFAPGLNVNNINIQEYLQSHYINAIKQVALTLKGLPNVIGFDTFNEPSCGYIGLENLQSYGLLLNGVQPTYYEGMVAAGGNSVKVSDYEFKTTGPKERGKVTLNPNRQTVWMDKNKDIWLNAGIWSYDKSGNPILKKAGYFSAVNGKKTDFNVDYYKPFLLRYMNTIRSVDPRWLIFAESSFKSELPEFSASESKNVVNASHWYDIVTLLTKDYYPVFSVDRRNRKFILGKKAIRETFHDQLNDIKTITKNSIGDQPTLIGEFGIPFDLDEKKSFSSGDFTKQSQVLDRSFRAMESNMLSYTLWNYTPDNTNERGDKWNGEDLSIFSTSQIKTKDINAGGRALNAAIRPYPFKVSGKPISYFYNMESAEFYLKYNSDIYITAPTEIFLPEYHYSSGFLVNHSPGKILYDKKNSLLLFYPLNSGQQELLISKK